MTPVEELDGATVQTPAGTAEALSFEEEWPEPDLAELSLATHRGLQAVQSNTTQRGLPAFQAAPSSSTSTLPAVPRMEASARPRTEASATPMPAAASLMPAPPPTLPLGELSAMGIPTADELPITATGSFAAAMVPSVDLASLSRPGAVPAVDPKQDGAAVAAPAWSAMPMAAAPAAGPAMPASGAWSSPTSGQERVSAAASAPAASVPEASVPAGSTHSPDALSPSATFTRLPAHSMFMGDSAFAPMGPASALDGVLMSDTIPTTATGSFLAAAPPKPQKVDLAALSAPPQPAPAPVVAATPAVAPTVPAPAQGPVGRPAAPIASDRVPWDTFGEKHVTAAAIAGQAPAGAANAWSASAPAGDNAPEAGSTGQAARSVAELQRMAREAAARQRESVKAGGPSGTSAPAGMTASRRRGLLALAAAIALTVVGLVAAQQRRQAPEPEVSPQAQASDESSSAPETADR